MRPADTEARQGWYEYGNELEVRFLKKIVPQTRLRVKMNRKKKDDPTVIDMIYRGKRKKYPADLKTQNTPFFMARRYGVPPQYAVTFNHKDYLRYKKLYPRAVIIFWVRWTTTKWNGRSVNPMHGVWMVKFSTLRRWIENEEVQLHTYKRRQTDGRRNAKDSYIFDLRDFKEVWRKH